MQNQALTGYEFEQQLKHKEFYSVGRAGHEQALARRMALPAS